MAETTHLEQLAQDPEAFAARVVEQLRAAALEERDSELVYTPTGEHSYYRDVIQGGPAAEQRLTRHREQMAHVELRAAPSNADGFGGYFSPPVWLNRLFATGNRPGRVLAGLVNRFPLPAGVSQINTPILLTGSTEGTGEDNEDVSDTDIVDGAARSVVEPIVGDADIAMQLLDLSPVPTSIDWALSMDLAEAYDATLEQRLLYGLGVSAGQIRGVMNVVGINTIPYTDASPTGGEIVPLLGQAVAVIGDSRLRPPECWLMRTARWAWFQTSEDLQNRPYGLNSKFFLGDDDETPDPVGGLLGFPVFLDDALPASITGNPGSFSYGPGTQDAIICLRPSDIALFEGEMQTNVIRDYAGSGTGTVRIQSRAYAGALTARRPSGISVVGGTGLTPISGF